MARTNITTTSLPGQSENSLPTYIREADGRYFIKKPVVKNEIITFAKYLVSLEYQNLTTLHNCEDSKRFFVFELAQEQNEIFCALFLNSQNQILAFEKLFVGSVNQAHIYPREIIKKALYYNATAIIFAHNHLALPIEPSQQDVLITKELKKTLMAIDIRVLDHIITCGNAAISLANKKLI